MHSTISSNTPIPVTFLKTDCVYSVFRTISKAAFFKVSGSYEVGQAYRNGYATEKSSVIEGSIDFQAGGKAFGEIFIFEDKRAHPEFIITNFIFNVAVQATAVTAGAEAQSGTTDLSASSSAGPKSDVQEISFYIWHTDHGNMSWANMW